MRLDEPELIPVVPISHATAAQWGLRMTQEPGRAKAFAVSVLCAVFSAGMLAGHLLPGQDGAISLAVVVIACGALLYRARF